MITARSGRVRQGFAPGAGLTWLVCACSLACSGATGGVGQEQSEPGRAGEAPTTTEPGGTSVPSEPNGQGSSSLPPASSGGTTGQPQGPTPAPPSTSPLTPPSDCSNVDASESVLRRLSRVEYQFTLKELFQLEAAPDVQSVPQDSDFKGFRTLASLQNVTTEHLRAYQELGERLATELLQDTARLSRVVGCDLEQENCLERFVTDFGRLAYRRGLEPAEVDAYVALARELDETPEGQLVTVISAMLSSANFLFRVEVGVDAEGNGLGALDGEELASRLSFTLLGRGPSKELLDKGSRGELNTPDGLAAEARALLSDPRAQEFYDAFFQQWLGFEQLRRPKQPEAWWNDALMLSMQEETQRFLRDYAWTQGADFFDSLTANHSYLRADLAEFYGLPAPAENGYVEFPEGHNRENSGLLTHAALLSAKRDGDRIAHRGAWVQGTFLCLDLELPTALLDSVSDELAGLTFDEIFDKRNTDAACAGCHALIDPIGIGLAAYDEAGHFRSDFDVNGFSVSPALPQSATPFATPGELASLLRDRAEVAQCLTRKLFLYTDGREAGAPDQCAIQAATERFTADQFRFAAILEGLVASPSFRLRKTPAAPQTQGEN